MAIIDKLSDYVRIELMEVFLYWFMVIVQTGIIPFVFVGLIGKAFSESFVNPLILKDYLGSYVVYIAFIIIALFLPIYSFVKLITTDKGQHVSEIKNPRWYHIFAVSYLFDPEQGFLWYLGEKLNKSLHREGKKNIMNWSKSIFRLIIIFSLLLVPLMIARVAFPKQMAFITGSDVPQLVLQQVTVISTVIFSAEPASSGETFTLCFILFFILGLTGYLCAKLKLGKGGFFAITLTIVPLLMGLIWMGLHGIINTNKDSSLQANFIFGSIGSFSVVFFGTILFFYLYHYWNNTFIGLQNAITMKEDIIFVGLIIYGIVLVFYVVLEVYLYSRKKKIGEDTYFNNG